MEALPPGWTAALSTTTGEKYYVNSVSGDTQFEFPDGPAEGMEDESLGATGIGGPRRTVSKDKPLPPGWDTATSRSTNQKFYVNVVTGESQTEFPSAPALPDGWDMATSQQTGRVYYLNSITGEISYDLPSMPARTREDEIAEVRLVLCLRCACPVLLNHNRRDAATTRELLAAINLLRCDRHSLRFWRMRRRSAFRPRIVARIRDA